jgi:hypothetical protein
VFVHTTHDFHRQPVWIECVGGGEIYQRRSNILYGILLEKTEGGQAHTLVESIPKDKQSGYEAYQAIIKHMEGSEMRKSLELQSKSN